jgi:2-succinyl-6-hydroxy-2,4-cyclohexadiene-1-carboxylate synthase
MTAVRPTLFLLHGFAGSPASWDAVLAALSDPPHLCPRLVGHGEPAPGASGVGGFEDEVDRLASLVVPEGPVHLAGYSLGARLALGLLVRHGQRFEGATLIGVHPGLSSDEERAERRRSDGALRERLETRGIEDFVDHWERQPLFASESRLPQALREQKRGVRLSHDPRELARSLALTGLAEMPDYGARAGSISTPITLMAGELDQKFSGLAHGLAGHLPAARVVIAPGAGHDLLLERPDLVALTLERQGAARTREPLPRRA